MRPFALFLWILSAAFGIILTVADTGAVEQNLYEAHGRRDPFVQLVSLSARQSAGLVGVENIADITIEGVVYDPKKGSIVIANGSVLKEGEEVGNVKAVKIKPDGVIFSINGMESFKPMYQEETKKKS